MSRKTFRKVITSEDLIEKISSKNKKLMDLFLKEKSRKCSDATIKGYMSDLNIFFCWVVENCDNRYYPEIKKFEISDYFTFCIDELKWNGKRFARMRSVLSSLSDVVIKLFDEDYPTFKNIINTVIESIPKEPVREKTILSDENIKNLLNHLEYDLNEYTEACLLSLAINSGCRIAELAQFTIDSINEDNTAYNGLMLETTHKIRTKGFGKQGKMMTKFIIKDLFLPYYYKYLEKRKEIVDRTGSTSNMLFLQNNGKPAKVTTFNSWKIKWEEYLNENLYYHNYRHYFCTSLVKKGLSKDIIMAIIGWSSDMVSIYCDLEDKDKDWGKDLDKLSLLVEEGKEV